MKKRRACCFVAVFSVLLTFILCSSRVSYINMADLPDTYECEYMKTICREAEEFELEHSKLTPEEQDESEIILKTYRSQCENAVNACKKSAKRIE